MNPVSAARPRSLNVPRAPVRTGSGQASKFGGRSKEWKARVRTLNRGAQAAQRKLCILQRGAIGAHEHTLQHQFMGQLEFDRVAIQTGFQVLKGHSATSRIGKDLQGDVEHGVQLANCHLKATIAAADRASHHRGDAAMGERVICCAPTEVDRVRRDAGKRLTVGIADDAFKHDGGVRGQGAQRPARECCARRVLQARRGPCARAQLLGA
jgi:hypothetical protein